MTDSKKEAAKTAPAADEPSSQFVAEMEGNAKAAEETAKVDETAEAVEEAHNEGDAAAEAAAADEDFIKGVDGVNPVSFYNPHPRQFRDDVDARRLLRTDETEERADANVTERES